MHSCCLISPQPNPVANAQLLVGFDDCDQPLSLLLRQVAQVDEMALRLHHSILWRSRLPLASSLKLNCLSYVWSQVSQSCSVDVNSAGHASSAKKGNTWGSKVKHNFLATVARTTKTEKLGWQIEKGGGGHLAGKPEKQPCRRPVAQLDARVERTKIARRASTEFPWIEASGSGG